MVFALPILPPDNTYNSFWNQVINGALTAGRRLNVAVEVRGLDVNDTSCESIKGYPDLLRSTVKANEDILGLVVIPYQPPPGCDVDVLGAIEEISASLPVIAINSNPTGGLDAGALAYVGQNETAAGREACLALAEAAGGEATVLVLGLDNGQNPGIIARFDGCAQVAKAQYIEANLGTETDAAAIVAALNNDTTINAILALGGNEVNAMLQALEETGRSGIVLGSFDWTADNTTAALIIFDEVLGEESEEEVEGEEGEGGSSQETGPSSGQNTDANGSGRAASQGTSSRKRENRTARG